MAGGRQELFTLGVAIALAFAAAVAPTDAVAATAVLSRSARRTAW